MKAHRIILPLLLLLLISNQVDSQPAPFLPPPREGQLDGYWEEIDRLTRRGEFELALEKLRRRRGLSESAGDTCSALIIDTWTARVYIAQNNLVQAISLLKETARLVEEYNCQPEFTAFKDLDKTITALECHLKGLDLLALKRLHEGLAWMEKAREIYLEIEDQGLAALVTMMMGGYCADHEEYQEALGYLNQVLHSPALVGNPPSRTATLGAIGCCYALLDQHRMAQDFLEDSLREAEKIELSPFTERLFESFGSAVHKVAYECEMSGRYRRALIYHDYHLRYARLTDNLRWRSSILITMGGIHQRLLELEKALEYYNQALEISRSTSDVVQEGSTLVFIATVYTGLNQWAKSNRCLNQALELAQTTKDLNSKSKILTFLGANNFYVGRMTEAIGYLKEALRLREKLNDRNGQIETLKAMWGAYEALGNINEAITCQKRVLRIAQETSSRKDALSALEGLSYLYRQLGDQDSSVHFWLEAFKLHASTKDPGRITGFLSGDEGAYFIERKYQAASAYLENELSEARQGGNVERQLFCRILLGDLHGYYSRDKAEFSLYHYDIAQELNRQIRNPRIQAYILYAKASICFYITREDEKALNHLHELLRHVENSNDISLQLDMTKEIAEFCRMMDKPWDAIEYLNKGLSIAKQSGQTKWQSQFYSHLGHINYILGHYQTSIEYRMKALAIAQEFGEVENEFLELAGIAWSYLMLSRFEEADTFANNALQGFTKTGNFDGILHCLSALIYANLEMGNNHLAMGYWDSASRISQYAKSIEVQLQSLLIVALAEMKTGFYERALKTLGAMLVLEELSPRKNMYILGQAYGAMGLTYLSMGDYKKAQLYLEKSLDIFQESYYRYGEATVLNKLAIVFGEFGQYDEALAKLCLAEMIFRDIESTKGQIESLLLRTYVVGKRLREEREEGLQVKNAKYVVDDLRNARELSKDLGDRANEASAMLMLGEYYLDVGQYDNAQKSLRSARTIAKQNLIPEALIASNHYLGKVLEEEGRYFEALDSYQEAIREIETLQSGLSLGLLKGKFLEERREVYDSCFKLLLMLDQLHPDMGYDNLAFTTCENAKARSLLDSISRVRSFESKRPQVDLSFDSAIGRRQERLRDTVSSAERVAMEKDLEILRDEISLLKSMTDDQKTVERSPGELSTPDVRYTQIQSVLDGRTVFLEYVIGERNSHLWVIGRDTFEIHRLPLGGKNLQEVVRDYVGTLKTRFSSKTEFSHHVELGKELFRILLSPVEDEIRTGTRLIMVPDGCLHYLPVEALILPSPNGSPQNYAVTRDVSYLISKTSVAYFHSGAVMLSIMQSTDKDREIGKTQYEILAFGDPIYKRGETYAELEIDRGDYYGRRGFGFDRLLYSGEEVVGIAKTFGLNPTSECINLRENASERRIQDLDLEEYRRIHFATHGILADEITWINQPALVLSLSEADDEFDGFLDTGEVYDLSLNADLVVLSACKTGLGEEIRGEGLVGLTHAFMHAGAKSLVVSLWDVNDRSTSLLMEAFYKNLKTMNKRDALRKAKLDLMSAEAALSKQRGVGGVVEEGDTKQSYSHPYYWAPFVLIGRYD